jgi:hypothetical protein
MRHAFWTELIDECLIIRTDFPARRDQSSREPVNDTLALAEALLDVAFQARQLRLMSRINFLTRVVED